MAEFTVNEMIDMQQALADHYQNPRETPAVDKGKKKTLWMLGEIGEIIDIEKKKGDKNIMENPEVREHFVEEMADVLMYYTEILMCYGITSDELKNAYVKKFQRNMTRWDKK